MAKYLTSEELCRVVQWKLHRGKFRPSLLQQAQSNADKVVRDISGRAFAALEGDSDVLTAIKVMAELRGVGPATASALLAAASPDVPFMSDEGWACIKDPSLGEIKYGFKEYAQMADRLRARAATLKHPEGWGARHVEQALWSSVSEGLKSKRHRIK